MINFFISIVIFAVSVFLLGVSIRYGLIGAGRLDNYFSIKSGKSFNGFNWYYRIPFNIGFIPEYFFYLVIGADNYFKVNWWPLKTSAFIAVLLALATLNSRTAVYDYYSFEMIRQQGIFSLITSGNFTWFLNIITLLYAALFVLIVIESIKMHGVYAPVRIVVYSVLCIMMANLTIIVLGLIVFVTIVYIAFKIIGFFFFSSNRSRRTKREVVEPEEETTSGILKGGLALFRADVKEWEQGLKADRKIEKETKVRPKVKIRRKRPKIKRTENKTNYNDDIPRLHPD